MTDVRQVGRELGERYILEGGVRKAGDRLRITAQLIEAETGTHLWADKYDGSLKEVFDLQDQITDSVVGVVEPSLRRSEIERSRQKRPESLDAYELFLRALPHMQALSTIERALSRNASCATAHYFAALVNASTDRRPHHSTQTGPSGLARLIPRLSRPIWLSHVGAPGSKL